MDYVVDLRRTLTNLLEDRLNGSRVASENVSKLSELRMLEKSSQVVYSHLSSGTLLAALTLLRRVLETFEALRDAIEEILDCSFSVEEGSSKSSHTLLSSETHAHEFVDLSLMFRVGGRFSFLFLLFVFLFFLFFFFVFFGRLGLRFFLGLRCWLGDLVHANDKVSILDAYFFDSVFIVERFSLKDDLKGFGGHTLGFLDFGFEGGNLNGESCTSSVASTSIWKTYPLRFLTFSFIQS